MRELVGAVEAMLVDIRTSGFDALLAPDDYAPSQNFARRQRDAGSDGIVYPSVRNPGGECIAAVWPDVIARPLQGRHFRARKSVVLGQRVYGRVATGVRGIHTTTNTHIR